MSDKEPYEKMNSYFGRVLNGNSLFRWEIVILDENLHEDDREKLGDGEFSFFNFVSRLVESHKAYNQEDYNTALELIDKLKNDVETVRDNPTRFSSIFKGLMHIIDISMITILLMIKKDEQCLKLLETSYPSSELNEREEAAILAVRSACSAMYSYNGIQEALDFIERAVRKDPDVPFWRFLKATYLYKLRVVSNPIDAPTLEEIDLFKKVNEEEENNPLFMVYLADVYRESASANSSKKFNFWFIPEESKKDSKEENDEMFKQAKILYEKAHRIRPECPKIAFRCSHGLMKLPQKYQNIKFAKQIIMDLMPKNEGSGCGNSAAAYYYHKFGGKPDLGMKHLKIAMDLSVFNAHMNSVRFSFNENSKECVGMLEKLLDIFEESPKRKLIYSQILSYHLFANPKSELNDDDLSVICDHLTNYLKTGGSRSSLEHHRSLFIQTNEPISLLDVVADEVKAKRGNQKLDPKFRQKLDSFVHSLNFFNICAWKGRSQNLRRLILDGKIPVPKSRCLVPLQPSNRNVYANNNSQKFNQKERDPKKWSGLETQVGFGRGQPRAGFGRGQPQAGFGRGQSQAGFGRGQPQAGLARGQPRNQPVGTPGRGRGQMPPRSNPFPKDKKSDGLEIPTEKVAEGKVMKTKQKEDAVKVEQVNQETRGSRMEKVKHRGYIEKRKDESNSEENHSVRRRPRDDKKRCSSSESSYYSSRRRHGGRRKYSESSYSDDSDSRDRYSKRNRRRRSRSSSSDSYRRRGSRHHRKTREYRESYDKFQKRSRRVSSVSSGSESRDRYRKNEKKRHSRDRSESVSSRYEKKDSRRARHRSPSGSDFSDQYKKYKKESYRRSHYRSVTPSGSVSSKYGSKIKSSRRTRDRSPSESLKESHRRSHYRSVTPSGSVSSKYGNRKKYRHHDRSLSKSDSDDKYRNRRKASHRPFRHRSITPSESASSDYERKISNRRQKDHSDREKSRKSEENEENLSTRVDDLSLDGGKKAPVQLEPKEAKYKSEQKN